jgi:hypothetical protein
MPHRDSLHQSIVTQSPHGEPGSLLRLLFSSYGLAAAVAVLASFAGAGPVASLLGFWLGGAVIVLVRALIPTARKASDARPVRDRVDAPVTSTALETAR